MRNAAKAGSTTRKLENASEEILNANGDSLSDLASSANQDNGEGIEDDEEDTELGKLSEDDEPGCVIGQICNTVQHCMVCFRQKQMRFEQLTHPGLGDAANCVH